MKYLLSIICLIGLSFSPVSAAGLQPQGVASRNVIKPGAEIPKRVMRHFNAQKRPKNFFGALALSKQDSRKWYATTGFNSAQVAADIARLTCEAKAGDGHRCETVALRVPETLSGTFAQLLKATGLSTHCEIGWRDVRIPRRRPMGRWGGCSIEHVSKDGPNAYRARESGHTLYIARNNFYADVLTFGPDPVLAKQEALASCQSAHESILRWLAKGRWKNPNFRIQNAADLTIEAVVTLEYIKRHKQLGRCRIIHKEILP